MNEFSADLYDFALPNELIAQKPAEPRDSSRLLVLDRRNQTISHAQFLDLPKYLDENDVLVANNTEVIRARLLGQRIATEAATYVANKVSSETPKETLGGKIEFLLLEQLGPLEWEGAFHASAKHRPGVKFLIPTPDGKGLRGELIRGASESPSGTVVAKFDRDPMESGAGEIPLPHYIDRESASKDSIDYQTLYAKTRGSAAAPTAGLHFTDRVLSELKSRGISWQEITLHVGLGTFRPVKTSDLRQHVMHEEQFFIPDQVATDLTRAKAARKRLLAVGTTSVRTLESSWDAELQHFRPGAARTSIFIYPGGPQRFQVVDRLLTNFHLPKSTLLMLVSAFAGRALVLAAYQEAVREKYRFFSYGDAMLIL